jgi:hypothetical protein
MASTHLKNSKGQYCLEQRDHKLTETHDFYKGYKIPFQSSLPVLGFNPSNMRAGIYNNILSNNPIDIESDLFGVGSTNLVKAKKTVYPSLNKLPEKCFFSRPHLVIPNPLVIAKNQREQGPYS